MCGIAGISFSPDSKINRRRIAGAFLDGLEVRGHDAAGFAWVDPTGDGYYKTNVRGSKLSTAKLPQNAQAVILHTRAATQGSPLDNENNHPVLSPSGDIRLVHNGVIFNDKEVRSLLGTPGENLPAVDTSVLPAVIEMLGVDSTDLLEGDAAAAWLDKSTGRTLHLAKFSHSPVSIATLADGSFVFASTDDILADALNQLNLAWYGWYPEPFQSLQNGEYLQIEDGYIVSEGTANWGEDYYSKWYSQYNDVRKVTSGQTTVGTPSENSGAWHHDDPNWEEWGDEDYETPLYRANLGTRAIYYTMSHDGDYVTYTNIDALRASMRWHAGLTVSPEFFTADDDDPSILWINHISDIGQVTDDGSAIESWIRNPHLFEDFREEVGPGIRDGVDRLRTLVGA